MMQLLEILNTLMSLAEREPKVAVFAVAGLILGWIGCRWAGKTAKPKSDKETAQAKEQLTETQRLLDAIATQDGTVWRPLHTAKTTSQRFKPRGPQQRKAKIISFFNLKGGVGKTTLSANLGVLLASEPRNKRVLLVDLDYQQSLSMLCVGGRLTQLRAQDRVINPLWIPSKAATDYSVTQSWEPVEDYPRASAIAAASGMAEAETAAMLSWMLGRTRDDIRFRLRTALHYSEAATEFDYIFLDCPPRLTTASVNALAASDYLIIPVMPDLLSREAMRNLHKELGKLHIMVPELQLQVLGIVGNQLPKQPTLAQADEWTAFRQEASALGYHVFQHGIRPFVPSGVSERFRAMGHHHQAELDALLTEIEAKAV